MIEQERSERSPEPARQEIRAQLGDAIGTFFRSRGYKEVETPLRIPVPAQELHIDAIRDGDMYLRTSPEFHMKRILAGGERKIFQTGPCWRAGEEGRLHKPEFTMLEWYRTGIDYIEIALETQDLLQFAAREVLGSELLSWGGFTVDLSGDWPLMDVRELFLKHAGWDPVTDYDGDRFDLDLVEKVEPALPRDKAVILRDYPREAAAFARIRGDVAERWELYVGGIEIANAYSELTDAAEQEERLNKIASQREALGKEVYPQDQEFLEAMRRGLPECAGVALGMDRTAMLFAGADSIHDI